jgi:hypothetical protein
MSASLAVPLSLGEPLLRGPLEQRREHNRIPGWTAEVVVKYGLGNLDHRKGLSYVVRLDGRASGPVYFTLDCTEMMRWNRVRRETRGLHL